MHVKIGDYRSWIGPYQISKFLTSRIPFMTDEKREKIDDVLAPWLATRKDGSNTVLTDFCQWVNSKKKRKIEVRIDPYDSWNLDSTLKHIIHPLLIQLKATSHSYGGTDKADVPEFLHSTYGTYDEHSQNYSKPAWDWVLDEMIWAFDPTHEELEYPISQMEEFQNRKANGYRLFGKYYKSLWD